MVEDTIVRLTTDQTNLIDRTGPDQSNLSQDLQEQGRQEILADLGHCQAGLLGPFLAPCLGQCLDLCQEVGVNLSQYFNSHSIPEVFYRESLFKPLDFC